MSHAPNSAPASAAYDLGRARSRELDALRRGGMVVICICGWTVTILLVLIALFFDGAGLWTIPASVLSNALATISMLNYNVRISGRLTMVLASALQPYLLCYSFYDAGLTPEPLLAFLIGLIVLATVCHVRAIAFGTVVSAGFFLSLGFVAPSRDFVNEVLAWRIMVEVIGLAMVGAISAAGSDKVTRLLIKLEKSRQEQGIQSRELKDQAKQLERALAREEAERQRRERSDEQRRIEREGELKRIRENFETSISTVLHSIATTARMLEQNASSLNAIANSTGSNADQVSSTAEAASKASRTVAKGVSELSSAISSIAVNVGQQKEMTARAIDRSSSGGQAVSTLSARSDTIGEATRAIVRVSERTNLISLNAAIEAASAGATGRGFTVVAQEVKALAKQAAEAATEIDALLSSVRAGTVEAERNFAEIDAAVAELDKAAMAIRGEVETQRLSADTIEAYARKAADDVGEMASQSKSLAETAADAKQLAGELDKATAILLENVATLEQSTQVFVKSLKAA